MECEDVIRRKKNKRYWWHWFHCHRSKWLFFLEGEKAEKDLDIPKKAR